MHNQELGRYQRVREVASSLFANRGYACISLRQLAEHLGMHAGSIYSHIESKQVLLYDLIRDHLENLHDYVEWQVRKSGDVEAKLRAFITGHIEFQLHYRELSQLSVLELRSLEPEYRQDVADVGARYRECLETIINEGIRTGLFHSQPLSVVANGVLGMLSGIIFWYGEEASLSREQLIFQYTSMVLRSLCGCEKSSG